MTIIRCDKPGVRFPFYGSPLTNASKAINLLLAEQVSFVFIRTDIPDAPVKPAPAVTIVQDHGNDMTEKAVSPEANDDIEPIREQIFQSPDIMHKREYETTVQDVQRMKTVHAKAKQMTRSLLMDVRMGKSVDTAQSRQVVNELVNQCFANPNVFVTMARLRDADDYTFNHSVNVCVLSTALGNKMNLSVGDVRQLSLGALLHDLGKMRIPDRILNKPEKLSDEEFAVMRKHSSIGYELLKRVNGFPRDSLDVVLQHHERSNGSGYPYGVKEDSINEFAKIVSICDVYDAITTDRVYHKGMIPAHALRVMFGWSGVHFNRTLISFFQEILGIYPVGTLVMLDSGELAVVLETNDRSPTQPKVIIVTDREGDEINTYYPVNLATTGLSDPGARRSIVSPLNPDKHNIKPEQIIDKFMKSASA